MNDWLPYSWQKRGWGACLLWPLSQAYLLLSAFHRWLYRSGVLKINRCAVPVIVVGNVVAGGAGKTPLVIALGQYLQRQGLKVGVVARGYGRRNKACVEVLEGTRILDSGDEPALIFRSLIAPVFVASKRFEAAQALLAKYPETQVILSDDGLQHLALGRDIDIIVFDDRGIGNGWLLPAGPLRQPYVVGQSEGELVLHTGRAPAFGGYRSTRQLASYALNAKGQQVALSSLKEQELTALAGISSPQAFFDMLSAIGLQKIRTISLPDHFDFSGYAWPVAAQATVLCTEKDAVKLFNNPAFEGVNLLAVPLVFSPEPAFFTAVNAKLSPLLQRTF